MKIAFVITEAENFAVQLFSAILKQKGHQVYLIFDPRLFNTDEIRQPFLSTLFDIREQNIEKIKKIAPDLVGFSVYTQDYQWALGMARMVKKEIPDIPIIFGGIHCILCPEQVIKEDCVDMICIGEGEEALTEMLNKAQLGSQGYLFPINIKNIWVKDYSTRNILRPSSMRPLIQDLDSLPFIDRDILYEQKPVFKKDISILTGRGCPYSCTFCASDALNDQYRENNLGKAVRKRSVAHIMSELNYVKEKYRPRSVYFVDDVFTINTEWLREFTKVYKRNIALPFYCTANPGTIREEELYLLKEAGCQMIGFGMQSCDEKFRYETLNRRGTNEYIKSIATICHNLNLHFSFDHIFNLPTESESCQGEAIRFYNSARPSIINTFTMTYLPKIELNKYLDEKTKQEVEDGKIRTGMFIRGSNNVSSVFSILPLLPREWVTFLCSKNLTRFIHLPYPLRLLLKDIKRLMIGRDSDVWFPIRLFIANIKDNILIKCGLR